ncbi:protein adenylyltransferase SelO [Pseudonocardia oceani]|uniref:protein adenylyltransferase SelO n=2 Tax=Pseudonocardia oceani TaxID=2792013 RepID=UPI001C4A1378|nr:YdiU family protein [Pseudonocardia oceani]
MTAAATLLDLDDAFARALPALATPWAAAPFPDPQLVVLNEPLAAELGVDPAALRTPAGTGLLVGRVPEGVRTVAQVYAGHQFGRYQPRLGDGRALLLGEVRDVAGSRRDLHLKGSGRTPYARNGDGKAVLGPMLREYVLGEAMHALGIPTTRALSVVTTGEQVPRERLLPGAVLCRVAASHLRVGTFAYAAATGDAALLRDLADHAIERHHPGLVGAPDRYLGLLRGVVDAQADLVARWMLVGFVHGVMNTDNTTISGETIDYGPCAFLDAYDPAAVFSSIDHTGRYAYGNQPSMVLWNLARFAEALLPLLQAGTEAAGTDAGTDAAVEIATEVLQGFAPRYQAAYDRGMAAKLGLDAPDPALAADLLELLHAQRVDHTGFFRALSAGTARDLFTDRAPFETWAARRDALLPDDRAAVATAMDAVNPVHIPRNHRVEEALDAATAGDTGPLHRLVDAVTHPFDDRPDLTDLAGPPEDATPYITYCGT